MFQAAFDALKGVASELATVNETLDARRQTADCVGDERSRVDKTRSQSEKTYLLRLLAEFESSLARLGPVLSTPVTFSDQDSLGKKMDQIGSLMGMDATFRVDCDDRIRRHRNELAHGRSPVPRVSFDTTHRLMKEFLRICR